MNKFKALIKASMFENMTMFKLKSKKKMKISEKIFPALLVVLCFFLNAILANIIIAPLHDKNVDTALLTLFILYTSVMTLVEGIYKSGSLIFNCKDDDLLLSLPIKRTLILLVRILKFYFFEVLYNALFLIPAMCIYVIYNNVHFSFYFISLIALFILPIIPVLLSCIIGGAISAYSSNFKFKNFAEIVVTIGSLLAIFYVSLNFDTALEDIATKAKNINNMVCNLYFPAGMYIKLVENFNIFSSLLYIFINIGLFSILIYTFSTVYFKINSKIKIIKTKLSKKDYKIVTHKPLYALIKKELNRFINSPVYVTNSVFGLALYIIGCITISKNYVGLVNLLPMLSNNISIEQIIVYMPVILFGLICCISFLTSITSAMISLEGKAFFILKSFPIKSIKIILSKVLTAMIIMIPFIILGDIIVIMNFKFNILEIIIILVTSLLLPFISETIGILVNLKYPRFNAENDTQIVKQSVSAIMSIFIGILLSALTIFGLVLCVQNGISPNIILIVGLAVFVIISIIFLIYLLKKSKEV